MPGEQRNSERHGPGPRCDHRHGDAADLRCLFTAGAIGQLKVPSRVLMAPMEKNYCTRDGRVTDRYLEYARVRAQGGAALLCMEATYVDPVGKGRMYQLGAHDDATIPGLRQLAKVVHGAGGRLSLELCHTGRQTNSAVSGFQPVAPSAVACEETGGYLPRELDEGEIVGIVARFAAAAHRARRAGVDAIELHGASGYLVNAFLSPFSNRRTDAYGGDLARRMRFPLEVVAAVREAAGHDMPLLYRLCAHEFVRGGLTLADTVPFAEELESAGVDLIDVSAGIYESILRTIPPMEAQAGELAELSAQIKRAVDIPVSVTGKLGDLYEAERILRDGHADFVTIGRGFHADPELLVKARDGRFEEIRSCIACSACSAFLGRDMPAYCAVNAATGRERQLTARPSPARRRVAVIGAGPAGLEAACGAARRGHDVTLLERAPVVGGQLRYGSLCRGREAFAKPAAFLGSEAARLGVDVRLGVKADPQLLKGLAPDAVIIATGAAPVLPAIPGADGDHVVHAFDYLESIASGGTTGMSPLTSKSARDARTVVLGAGWIACQVADLLLQAGTAVTLVDVGSSLAADIPPRSGAVLRQRVESNADFTAALRCTVEKIDREHVTVWNAASNSEERIAASAVIATELEPDRTVEQELASFASDGRPPIYLVGDCVRPRDLHDAVFEGAALSAALA